MPHRFAHQSRRCREVLPNTSTLASSDDVGWTSLLALHARSNGACDPYETSPTPDQTIVVLTRGEMGIESFGNGRWKKAVYRPGSAGTTAPNEVDRLRWGVRTGWDAFETLRLFVPQGLIAEAGEHFRRPGQRVPTGPFSSLIFRNGALAEVAGALLSALRAGAPDLYAQTTAQWLAMHLVCARLGADGDTRQPALITDARLARALDYISANLARDVTLDAVAAEAGVSKFHFVKLFRERLGATPIRYLMDLRLDTAARLLITSDLPVGRIAAECGCANRTHFSAAFRRRHGQGPEAYRRTASRRR